MEARLNINVSAIDYDKTSKIMIRVLQLLEDRLHKKDEFVITDSEFAFGWHFFVVSINQTMVDDLAAQMGQDFDMLKGRDTNKKFLSWLTAQCENLQSPRFKIAIKEEMESSKFGIF